MAWFDSNWGYRMSVTVEASRVSANLTDFPVYVDLSKIASNHAFWSNVDSAGADIRVTTSDGTTEIPVEIVSIDTSAKTGEIHFKGDIDSTDDTPFWLYFGNSSATLHAEDSTYGKENTWDSNHVMVHHLTGATVTDLDDSTSNDYDFSVDNGDPTYDASTQVGEGVDFDGTGDFIDWNGNSFRSSDTSGTLSMMIQKANLSINSYFMSTSSESVTNRFFSFITIDTGKVAVYQNAASVNIMKSTNAITVDTWHYITASTNGSTTKLYIDGVEETVVERNGTNQGLWIGDIVTATNNMIFGALKRSNGEYPTEQIIAEARLSDSQRSDDWILTESNNLLEPETFVTFGDAIAGPPAPTFVPKVDFID